MLNGDSARIDEIGDLMAHDDRPVDQASNEVQFALAIVRMTDAPAKAGRLRTGAPADISDPALCATPPPKPNPLRPTDYGVYAIEGDSLTELQLLPGRPPDIRIAVSAALKMPSRTVPPTGHPKIHRIPPRCRRQYFGPRGSSCRRQGCARVLRRGRRQTARGWR
jgi:hypothetical protein